MPAKSAKQYRFMQGIAHGMKPKSGIGPSPEVAKEFIAKTSKKKRKEFSDGKR
jgi:hypothetical protein